MSSSLFSVTDVQVLQVLAGSDNSCLWEQSAACLGTPVQRESNIRQEAVLCASDRDAAAEERLLQREHLHRSDGVRFQVGNVE